MLRAGGQRSGSCCCGSLQTQRINLVFAGAREGRPALACEGPWERSTKQSAFSDHPLHPLLDTHSSMQLPSSLFKASTLKSASSTLASKIVNPSTCSTASIQKLSLNQHGRPSHALTTTPELKSRAHLVQSLPFHPDLRCLPLCLAPHAAVQPILAVLVRHGSILTGCGSPARSFAMSSLQHLFSLPSDLISTH